MAMGSINSSTNAANVRQTLPTMIRAVLYIRILSPSSLFIKRKKVVSMPNVSSTISKAVCA